MRLIKVVAALSLLASSALAQSIPAGAPGAANLTEQDKAAISTILDALGVQSGDQLNTSITGALNGSGVDAKGVVRVVKFAAGPRLVAFQSVLTQTCLGGQASYCTLAAIPAPNPDKDTKTAATDGPGAPGAGGFGGSPQVNQGHLGAFGGSGLSFARNSSSNPVFSFAIPSFFGGSSTIFNTFNSTPPVVAPVPGPTAGAGLPAIALAALAAFFMNRKRRKVIR